MRHKLFKSALLLTFLLALTPLITTPANAICIDDSGRVDIGDSGTMGGDCEAVFGTQLNALIDVLTGPIAITVALVGLVSAGAMLIFQGGELRDFVKTLLTIVLVACLMILAGQVIGFFFGSEQGDGLLLPHPFGITTP